ncbi:MAG: hypothetical protein GY842_22255 [bacterium]|nr:hypothetical protein [bacterium]
MIELAPFTHCPVCTYSLRGLPPDHRCPECGLRYDEGTLVFRPRRPRLGLLGTAE